MGGGESWGTEGRTVVGRARQERSSFQRHWESPISVLTDEISCCKTKVFYLLYVEITSSPVTLFIWSGGFRGRMAICERVLSEFCVGDSFSLHLVEYFYVYNLGIPNIIL